MQAEYTVSPEEGQTRSDAPELVGRIQQALKRDNLEEARQECHSLEQEPGQQAAAEHLFGLIELRAGDYAQALPRFEAALALQEDRPDMWANYGSAQVMLGGAEKAISSLQRAIELDPEYEDALLNLGALYLRTERVTEALDTLDQAVQIRPSARGFSLLAQGLYKQGNTDNAATCALAAYNLGPEDGETRAELMRMLGLVGHSREARLLAEGMVKQENNFSSEP